jgi:hypothetical protein
MAGIARVALPIARFVAVKVVELRFPAPGQRSAVSMMRIKAVVNVTIKTMRAVKPRTGSKEYPANKPIGTIVAIGSAFIRLIVKVPIGAHGSCSDFNCNLCWPKRCAA